MPETCRNAHRQEFETEPACLASAPASLHILGELVEYARGHVLSLALPQRVFVAVSSRNDNLVRLYSSSYTERKKFSLSNLKYKKEDRWANLIKGILNSLDNFGCRLQGINVTIWSSIPEGRGLGSSSALGVATTLALCEHFNFSLNDAQIVWLVHMVETQYCGRPNHLASCFVSRHAHAGALFALDLRALEYRHLRLSQGEFSFWVLDSMVNPLGARQELNERKRLFEQLRTRVKPLNSGRDVRDYSMNEARELLDDAPEDERRVGLFAIDEWNRLHQAEDAVEASNIPPLGKILLRSHEGLRDQMEMSCPELDWLVKHCHTIPGILGARLSGLGFGACVVLLVQGSVDLTQVLSEYERIFGFKPSLFRAVPSHKAQLHTALGGAAEARK